MCRMLHIIWFFLRWQGKAITPLEEKSYTTGWRTKNITLEGEIIKNITLDDKKRTTLEGEKVIKTNYEKTILEERNKKKLHWRTQNKKKPWRTQNKSSYLGGEENAASAAIYVQHSQLSTTDKCKSIRLKHIILHEICSFMQYEIIWTEIFTISHANFSSTCWEHFQQRSKLLRSFEATSTPWPRIPGHPGSQYPSGRNTWRKKFSSSLSLKIFQLQVGNG